ncbi:hypothetical protein HanPI659440_Chr01g0012381 [Helianthus annuus]|nr:hypothetical protein HanPI659440_Chr01g0012381 [Helianthus annuus]
MLIMKHIVEWTCVNCKQLILFIFIVFFFSYYYGKVAVHRMNQYFYWLLVRLMFISLIKNLNLFTYVSILLWYLFVYIEYLSTYSVVNVYTLKYIYQHINFFFNTN